MNTRTFVQLDSQEKEYYYEKLPVEHETVFRSFIEEERHFQEITQLYQMMLFDLEQIFLNFNLSFNDVVMPVQGQEMSIVNLNALFRNAISSARSLIDSIDVYDQVYVSEENLFKNNYISRAYDEYFSYKLVDYLRNYYQHGHVPVSFDGSRIYFQMSEILDVSHMKVNKKLEKQLKDIQEELVDYGAMDTRLAVVPTLYEYFLLIHALAYEFFNFINFYRQERFDQVKNLLLSHPEYITDMKETDFVPVYLDEYNLVHGFSAMDTTESGTEYWIAESYSRLEQYSNSNEKLFFLYIKYCLEYRMSIMRIVDEHDLSKNLVQFCLESGTDIHFISFDDYYECSEMSALRVYPFIQYEDGVHWNVPYSEVTIADFLRTFPDIRKKGLKVNANNVGSGIDEIIKTLLQDWSSYICQAKAVLAKIGINSPADAIDWAVRIEVLCRYMRWVMSSFSKKKEHKPTFYELRSYIKQKKEWNIYELMHNLDAKKELLELVLEESGYVYRNKGVYKYDEEIANRLENERQKYSHHLYDNHGTSVNCYGMNQALDSLNSYFQYLAVLMMEQGEIDKFDLAVRDMILKLKKCEQFAYWDELTRTVKIVTPLPEGFSDEDEMFVWGVIMEMKNELDKEISDYNSKIAVGLDAF